MLRIRFASLAHGVLLVAGLSGFARVASANCGAEGCPLAAQGPESPGGRVSFSLGYQFVEQNRMWDGGHSITTEQALAAEGGIGHILEQTTRTRTWTLESRVRVNDRLGIDVSLPYVDRIHRHALAHHAGFFIESEWHMTGIGDASAVANVAVFGEPAAASGALSTQLGVKLPTGKRQVEEIDGEQPEPPARPGNGSTDLLFGAQYRRQFEVRTPQGHAGALPLTAGVTARINGKGTDEYRSGNEWQAQVTTAYPLTRALRLIAQVNGIARGRDDVGNTDAEPHSTGGLAVLGSPGLQAEILPGVNAFGYMQFRILQHTNGPQLVSPSRLSFGLAYALK